MTPDQYKLIIDILMLISKEIGMLVCFNGCIIIALIFIGIAICLKRNE